MRTFTRNRSSYFPSIIARLDPQYSLLVVRVVYKLGLKTAERYFTCAALCIQHLRIHYKSILTHGKNYRHQVFAEVICDDNAKFVVNVERMAIDHQNYTYPEFSVFRMF